MIDSIELLKAKGITYLVILFNILADAKTVSLNETAFRVGCPRKYMLTNLKYCYILRKRDMQAWQCIFSLHKGIEIHMFLMGLYHQLSTTSRFLQPAFQWILPQCVKPKMNL